MRVLAAVLVAACTPAARPPAAAADVAIAPPAATHVHVVRWTTDAWTDAMCEPGAVLVEVRAACDPLGPDAARRFHDAVMALHELPIDEAPARTRARHAVQQAAIDVLCTEPGEARQVISAFDALAGEWYVTGQRRPLVAAAIAAETLDTALADHAAELPGLGQLLAYEVRTYASLPDVPLRCRERLRGLVASDAARWCARGARKFVDLPAACTWLAELGCAIAEDDTRALARTGDHRAASDAFADLAFAPPIGCRGRRDLGVAAVHHARAAGDHARADELAAWIDETFGPPPPILRAPPWQKHRRRHVLVPSP
jgi:hypothetical protein